VLLRFHEHHFPSQPLPPLSHPTLGFSSSDALDELENPLLDDDLLGHYDDGVKRTLSDDQVAIFRHTEIQESLRRRRERDGPLPEAANPSTHNSPSIDAERTFAEKNDRSPTPWSIHEHEMSETRDNQPTLDSRGRHTNHLSPSSRHFRVERNNAKKFSDPDLQATHLACATINSCPRKIIKYEEDDTARLPRQTAAPFSRDGAIMPRFAWPEIRNQSG
jgi:Protein of unknown function (DUF3807)